MDMEAFMQTIPEDKRHILMQMKNAQEQFSSGDIPITEMEGKKFPPGFFAETVKFVRDEWNGIRENDVFVASFPKTGTNWLGEVVNRILSHENPQDAKLKAILPVPLTGVEMGPAMKFELQDSLPLARRLMITHMDGEDFPVEKACKKGAKILYVLRNPKDQTVSWFHFANKVPAFKKTNLISDDWKTFTQDYFLGKHPMCVREGDWYPENILSWYKHKKEQENVKFIYYEDMKENLSLEVKHIAEFLGVEMSDEKASEIAEACSFDSMKKNIEKDDNIRKTMNIMRKGGVGGWKDYFTVAQSEAIDAEFDEKLSNTDIKFKYVL